MGEERTASESNDEPIGMNDNPHGDELEAQQAVDEIQRMYREAQTSCYAPEDRDKNLRNAGRVRALSQALVVLERAGLTPTEDGYE